MKKLFFLLLLAVSPSVYASIECQVESLDKFDNSTGTNPLIGRKTTPYGDLKYLAWDSQEDNKVLIQVIQSTADGRGPDVVLAEADAAYPNARLYVRLSNGEARTVTCK